MPIVKRYNIFQFFFSKKKQMTYTRLIYSCSENQDSCMRRHSGARVLGRPLSCCCCAGQAVAFFPSWLPAYLPACLIFYVPTSMFYIPHLIFYVHHLIFYVRSPIFYILSRTSEGGGLNSTIHDAQGLPGLGKAVLIGCPLHHR